MFDSWHAVQAQTLDRYKPVLPAVTQVWNAMQRGGAGTASEGKALLSDAGDTQGFFDATRIPLLEKLLPKIGDYFESAAARTAMRLTVWNGEQAGIQLVQGQLPYLMQDLGSAFSQAIPGVQWSNGKARRTNPHRRIAAALPGRPWPMNKVALG